jgi:hypothetical protein
MRLRRVWVILAAAAVLLAAYPAVSNAVAVLLGT